MKEFISTWFTGVNNNTNGALLVFFAILALVGCLGYGYALAFLESRRAALVAILIFMLTFLCFMWLFNGQSFQWSAAIAAWLKK